ncbi:MAG: bifunctional tetrahydrofolate synthase/dihydrofolate synthase [Oleiphilaceae bacterium]|nr:bifunctional tetrahydrofolate synthase/dihydrofolate synthase [Oleiphilaceae bacterium]
MPQDAKRTGSGSPGPGASLDQWLNYLEALHPSEIDLGLDRVLLVLRRLLPKPPRARIITVAGTNGKGTTVACIEALLLAAGRRVGAYTSPHLNHYNERIRIQGQDVEDAALIAAFQRIDTARAGISLTYFEFGTLAAFLVMDAAGVEDWVLEVGLGGRLDAVNVLDPDLAIVTSVDIDHVSWLGADRDSIGFEKAGIFRTQRPAIYADNDPPQSVLQQAQAQQVRLWRFGEHYSLSRNGRQVDIPELGRSVPLPLVPLPGTSIAAAVRAGLWLEPALSDRAIQDALARVRVPGRFECVHSRPDVILDVGHNPHAARWLAGRLVERAGPGAEIHAVYACLSDKDAAGVVKAMSSVVTHWFLAGLDPVRAPRGLGVDALEEKIKGVLPEVGHQCFHSLATAIDRALDQARPEDVIIIFGSFFTVTEARSHLESPGQSGFLNDPS